MSEEQVWKCETCDGTGKIDQRLTAYCESGVVNCPDCDGKGEWTPSAPPSKDVARMSEPDSMTDYLKQTDTQKMKLAGIKDNTSKITAQWCVELNCECPACDEYVDLMNAADFWEGKSTLEIAEHGTEKSNNLQVTCPKCGHDFVACCEY